MCDVTNQTDDSIKHLMSCHQYVDLLALSYISFALKSNAWKRANILRRDQLLKNEGVTVLIATVAVGLLARLEFSPYTPTSYKPF